MNTLQQKIELSNQLLKKVYINIDKLTFENFDVVFPSLVEDVSVIKKLRDEMIKNYGSENIKKYDPEMFNWAKQIERKFDNIVEIFTEEEKRLETELSATLTKKKLIAYKR
ncbi:MAG: hypothetical protein ACOYU5_07615 [Stygiobacter sp.]